MEALGLSEDAAERLAGAAGFAPNGQLPEAADLATAGAVDQQTIATAASHSIGHGDAPAQRQAVEQDEGDNGSSLLDGLDTMDPDYWDEPPAQPSNGKRHSSKPTQQPAAKQSASSEAHGRSRADPGQREQAAQRHAEAADDESDDGAGMGLFDEEAGVEWDAPPAGAKAPPKAAPQRPGGKALKGVFKPLSDWHICGARHK